MGAEECKRQINKIKSDIIKCEQKQRKLNQTLKNVKLKSFGLYLKEVVKPYVESGKIVLDGDYRKVVRLAFDRGLQYVYVIVRVLMSGKNVLLKTF